MLAVTNLEVVYDDVILVLRGVSIEIPEGKIVALLGANGAGRTTLLRAITGLLDIHEGEITKGEVTLDGDNIRQARRVGLQRADQARRAARTNHRPGHPHRAV